MSKSDPINHPAHYARAATHPSGMECIDIIRELPCCWANSIKYLYRADSKGQAAQDYRKAAWYLRDIAARGGRVPRVSMRALDALWAWQQEEGGAIRVIAAELAWGAGPLAALWRPRVSEHRVLGAALWCEEIAKEAGLE